MQYIASAWRTDIAYRDIIENEEDARELLAVGGKKQVPCRVQVKILGIFPQESILFLRSTT
jgi:hypothetical protein